MLTSAECQAKANEKFAQAERNPRNQKRLLAAAEGWAALAEILRRHEASLISPNQKSTGSRRRAPDDTLTVGEPNRSTTLGTSATTRLSSKIFENGGLITLDLAR